MEDKRFDIEQIRHLAEKKLVEVGIENCDAKIVVDSMLEADMNGVSTHGIRMLSPYIDKIEKNVFSKEKISIVNSSPAFSVVDSKNAIGALSASSCTEICIEKAKQYGVHTVFARNCNTLGPAFYYVEKMAAQDLIGFVCCNAPAAMPVFNGLETMLGTNPFAFAFPSATEGMIVMDMATSVVAKSRLSVALANNESIPLGWALDAEGRPTTDPMEAIKGFVLPMAGFKGYGIALAIDLLSGFLSGSGYLKKVNKFYSQDSKGMNVGQMFVAFDPKQIYGNDFLNDMDSYIRKIRESKSVEGRKVALPGDDRVAYKKESLRYGIRLTDDTVEKLEGLFGETLKKSN